MPDLRETLARHFAKHVSPDGVDPTRLWDQYPDMDTAREDKADWYTIADECIRQMEWARHDALREFVSDDAKEIRPLVARLPLTAAPEGWKP